jgi:alpha,alpha-trehalose phosphorylase
VYTNLMAARNLTGAAEAAERHPDAAAKLGVSPEEPGHWRHAAENIHIPYDDVRKVHPQADNFTHHEVWPFEKMTTADYPLLLHYPYFDLYRKQVVKQADLVMALYTNGDYFSDDEKARNFAYYEAITVRDSSLSAATQGIIAAETGHLQLAYEYLQETVYVDLHNLAHNTSDGLHLAASAGGWMGLVAGFGGFRDYNELPCFAPRLPEQLTRLAFKLRIRGNTLLVDISHDQVTYSIEHGEGLRVTHHGEEIAVIPEEPTIRKIEPMAAPEPVTQPKGRAPSEIKPSTSPLDETGTIQEIDSPYAHQSGSNV